MLKNCTILSMKLESLPRQYFCETVMEKRSTLIPLPEPLPELT